MDYRDLPYDAEIEYLHSPVGSYIVIPSNFNCEEFTRYVSHFQFQSNIRQQRLFNTYRRCVYVNGSGSLAVAQDSDWVSSGLNWSTECVVDVDTHKRKTFFYDKSMVLLSTTKHSSVGNASDELILFGSGTPSQNANVKCWDFKAYIDDDLVLDLIPVRVGNVGYMYDKVSGQLFGNSGTGSFVLGSDVAPGRYANEIAFLESTGSQYIDTGITANGEFDFDFKLRIDSWSTNSVYAGARSSSQLLTICQSQNGQNFVFAYLNNVFTPQQTFPIGKDYVIQASFKDGSQIVSVNNVEILNESYTGSEELNMPIYLFKRSFYDSSDSVAGLFGKIYYFKIWQNDTLVRDFIPVEYNNIGYMYDKVSGEFFANQGTGKFVLGHRAPRFDGKACARSYTRRQLMSFKLPYDAEIEYLQSTGTQYINTGKTFKSNIRVVFSVIYTQTVTQYNQTWGLNRSGYEVLWGGGIFLFGGKKITYSNPVKDTEYEYDYDFTAGKMVAKINNTIVQSTSGTQPNASEAMYIFAMNSKGGKDRYKAKHSKFKLYENGVISLDLIPVRVGQVGYMYDKVSGQLFGNAGTGSFILGPDK